MKKQWEQPKAEILLANAQDIICSSVGGTVLNGIDGGLDGIGKDDIF